MRQMYDASTPPTNPPQREVVAGYIGGGTPHVWTDAEWEDQAQKSGAQYRLPIFVRVPPTSHNPTDDARIAINWFQAHNVPKDVCVALDYETAVDATYLRAFDSTIVTAGYRTLLYGSIAFVTRNPKPSGGYWIADWTGIPHLNPGAAATQWSGSGPFGGAYDPSLVADSTPLWRTNMAMLDAEDKAWIVATIKTLVTQGDRPVPATGQTHPNNIKDTRDDLSTALAKLDEIKAVITSSPGGSADTAVIKQAVKDALKEGTGLT